MMEAAKEEVPTEVQTQEMVDTAAEADQQQETRAAVQHLLDYNRQVGLSSPLVTLRGLGLQTPLGGRNTWRALGGSRYGPGMTPRLFHSGGGLVTWGIPIWSVQLGTVHHHHPGEGSWRECSSCCSQSLEQTPQDCCN